LTLAPHRRAVNEISAASASSVALPTTTGCGTRAGVLLGDSHHVAIRFNSFSRTNTVFKTDTLSTGITSGGNTVNQRA
jgi:hypothetical protein